MGAVPSVCCKKLSAACFWAAVQPAGKAATTFFYHDLLPGFFQRDRHAGIKPELLSALCSAILFQLSLGLCQDLRFQCIRLCSGRAAGAVLPEKRSNLARQVRQLRKKDC